MKNKKELDKNFDYLTILVKRDKLEEVESRYKDFSWEILNEQEHERFGNIVVVELRRPHYIDNKDELQFFQVQMEFLLNSRAECEKKKHSKSKTFGLLFGLLSTLIFVLSVLVIINSTSIIQIVLGSVFGVIGLIFDIVVLKIVINIAKGEDIKFNEAYEKISKDLDAVCGQVSKK